MSRPFKGARTGRYVRAPGTSPAPSTSGCMAGRLASHHRSVSERSRGRRVRSALPKHALRARAGMCLGRAAAPSASSSAAASASAPWMRPSRCSSEGGSGSSLVGARESRRGLGRRFTRDTRAPAARQLGRAIAFTLDALVSANARRLSLFVQGSNHREVPSSTDLSTFVDDLDAPRGASRLAERPHVHTTVTGRGPSAVRRSAGRATCPGCGCARALAQSWSWPRCRPLRLTQAP
jgi:hypothetical protein